MRSDFQRGLIIRTYFAATAALFVIALAALQLVGPSRPSTEPITTTTDSLKNSPPTTQHTEPAYRLVKRVIALAESESH
jgi:hypothetical protein